MVQAHRRLPVKALPLLHTKPSAFDGFGFYVDPETQEVVFNYFDDVAREHGHLPGDPTIPADREAYHVLLSSIRKGRVHIEQPFTSTFIDAFVYAAHVARAGFTGIMIRENKFSLALLEATLIELITLHTTGHGFVMQNAQGVDVFYKGLKKEQS